MESRTADQVLQDPTAEAVGEEQEEVITNKETKDAQGA
jgi:hypothetical protein